MANDKLPYNLRPQHRTLGQAEKKNKQVLVHARVDDDIGRERIKKEYPNKDVVYKRNPYAGKKPIRKILSDSFAEVRGKYK